MKLVKRALETLGIAGLNILLDLHPQCFKYLWQSAWRTLRYPVELRYILLNVLVHISPLYWNPYEYISRMQISRMQSRLQDAESPVVNPMEAVVSVRDSENHSPGI